ncbi:hypothetical protein Tco_0064015 [Tanacetum coccineum]
MLVIKRFKKRKKVFRERKKTEKIHAKRGSEGEAFLEEGGDFGVSVVRLQTCLTEILGFLEKSRGGFEQDIDDEVTYVTNQEIRTESATPASGEGVGAVARAESTGATDSATSAKSEVFFS